VAHRREVSRIEGFSDAVGFGGFVYGLIGVVEWRIGTYHGRQLRRLERR